MVALAGTAIPFAHSAEDEAERWLRAHAPPWTGGLDPAGTGRGRGPAHDRRRAGPPEGHGTPPFGPDVLEKVTDRAAELATGRGAENVGTTDILFAVLDIYGKLFDRVLYLRGTSREELAERLTAAAARH